MKNVFLLLLALLCMSNEAWSYSIKVKITGLKNDTCYLGHYFGQKQYTPVDTAVADANGNFTFAENKELKRGVYLIIIPKTYLELIVGSEQDIKLEADTSNTLMTMKPKGSAETEQFYAYQKFMSAKMTESKNADSITLVRLRKEVEDYRKNMFAQHPKSLTSKLLKAAEEPTMPEFKVEDSIKRFYYYRNHYFDNYDFTDEAMLRTPIFIPRIERFLNELTVQAPDSIIKSLKILLDKAEAGNKEIFKYCVATYANKYETSKIICMDKVFVWVGRNYYLQGKCFWADTSIVRKIRERVTILEPLQCDRVIPNAPYADTLGTYVPLHNVKGKYTVAIFWSPDCGHCQKEIPKLFEIYNSKLKSKGVKIYAANIEREDAGWKRFLKEKKLFSEGWYNVWDRYTHVDYTKTFDVYSTPVIYILDEKKRIIAKRLAVEQIEQFITDYDKIKRPN